MTRAVLGLLLALGLALPTVTAEAADAPAAGGKPSPMRRTSNVPRLYVATGPVSDAGLARLRETVGKLAGIEKVTAAPELGAITVTVDGDGTSTESLITAAARSAGYLMRPVRPRIYAATGMGADLDRLRTALQKLDRVEEVALSACPGGAAVRVLGMAPPAAIKAAGRSAGFELDGIAAYVASGPDSEGELRRLRAAVETTRGVQRLEMQRLSGGATLLVRGDVADAAMAAAGNSAGYDLWPLGNPPGPRLFRIEGGSAEPRRLEEALRGLEGIGKIELGPGSERLSVTGGRVRPDAIIAAAKEAGISLASVEPPVTLPTLEPAAQRSTPPDYDARVLEEKAHLGMPAPGFSVRPVEGGPRRSLADYLAAGKPVALIFGSCT
jgi:copper chaperone CopZ